MSVQGRNARLNATFVATLQLGLRGISRERSGVALFQKLDGRFQLVQLALESRLRLTPRVAVRA